jgi:hypothetical protein
VRSFPCFVFFATFLCPTYPALAQSFNQIPLPPANHTYGGNPAAASRARVAMSQLPLTFEPNVGQGIEGTDYLARSGALQIGLSASRMDLRLLSHGDRHALGISLANSNTHALHVTSERGTGESNYLLGNDASAWRTHIPQYQRVTYGGVYPGVDLTFYGNGEKVEHDFVVQPGADYRQIRMRYEGADQLSISRSGDLHVKLGESEVLVRVPHIYQTDNGHQLERGGNFVLLSKNEVGFQVKAFNPALTLVIDPVLDYATYLADLSLYVYGTAVDTAGNTYVAGLTFYSNYPITPGAAQSTCSSCASNQPDIFITKLNAAGTAQVYSTFLGGSNYEQPSKITVDSNGNAIVVGSTQSTDFPLKNPISAGTASSSNRDGFVTSLAPDGASLNFSSRLGGTDSQGHSATTFPGSVTTDSSGNVYVSGTTQSAYLPVTSGAMNAGTPGYPNNYVFLTKLQSSGNLIYSAIIGATGSASDCCSVAGIEVDSDGNAYIAGTVGVTTFTSSTPWPITAGAYQSAMISPGETAPFVAKVSPDASTLLYSTLVTTGVTSGMALTPDHQVILVGTANYNYPVTSDAYSSKVGTSFIAKLSADASQLAYSTYFSTPTADTGGYITNLALDPTGNVWIAGNTQFGNNIPMVNPLQSLPGTSGTSSGSAFVSEFDPLMHTLLFSTYFNGVQGGSRINGIAIDSQGRAHITGTGMDDLPTTSSAYLRSVTPPPPNYTYTYGFAALIDPTQPGPGICFSNPGAFAQVGTSGQANLTVTNCGNAPLNISNVQLTSPLFALATTSSCIGMLGASSSCTIPVTFTPTLAGNYGASVVITSNATVPIYNVPVSGHATAPSILTPASVTFPPQVLGVSASGSPLPVFAANTGTAPLIVNPSTVTITGDFSIVSDDCGSPVPTPSSPSKGSACVITIAFQPTALGSRTGTLTLTSNDPVHPTITVPLSGTAIAAYSTPTITGLSIPAVALGTSAAAIRVLGTNFFPTSYVVINGEPHPTAYQGAGSLAVTVDPSLLSIVGELPVLVVNPSPGGQSAAYPLTVFRTLPISAAGLVYNSVTRMLYASIPANATTNPNTILPIDPLTGKFGTPIPVGNNPAKLALSDDGTYLYVALNGDHTLQRINLTTSQVERTFPLPVDTLVNAATTVDDMHVVPGSPQSVVVSLFRNASPGEAGAALFTDSGLSSFLNNNPAAHPYDSFTFTSDLTKFYSYPFGNSFFGIMGVSSTTLTPLAPGGFSCCNQTTGSIVVSDGSLLYTNSGQVWNPVTSTLLGTYPGLLFYEPSLAADAGLGRTYILDSRGYNSLPGVSVLSFNPSNYSFAGSVSIPVSLTPAAFDLLRWGADGFAFHVYGGSAYGDSSDQILILRSSIAQTATGGTPSLSALLPASAAVGSTTFQLTVNGSIFIPGSVVLWNGSPRQTTYVSATQLVALIPSSDIATAAAVQIVVTNPAPGGGSAALTFYIAGPGSNTPQTISFPAPASPVNLGAAPITLLATATSSLPVTFTVTGPATLTGNTLQFTGAGTVVVTASQVGNNSYTAAPPVSRTVVVSQATPTVSLSSSANPAVIQNAVTLSATVSSAVGTPTGTVSFLDGTTELGSVALISGGATFTTSTLSAGSHQITAVYAGDTNFVTLTSASLTENVQDFSLNIAGSPGASASQTVSPGGTATYALTSSPIGSTFPAAVALTVSGLPAGASYTLTPTTIAAGAGATNIALTIQVPANAASLEPRIGLSRGLVPITLGILLLPLSGRLRRSAGKLNGIVLITLLALAGAGAMVSLIGCGTKGSSPPAPTAQNYTITVTGTSGALAHTTNLTLTVK